MLHNKRSFSNPVLSTKVPIYMDKRNKNFPNYSKNEETSETEIKSIFRKTSTCENLRFYSKLKFQDELS